jgi:hypothetical protein
VLPIGQASLWAFTTHFVVIVDIYNLPFFHEADNTFIGTLWHLAAIVVVWATIMLRNVLMAWLPHPQPRTIEAGHAPTMLQGDDAR